MFSIHNANRPLVDEPAAYCVEFSTLARGGHKHSRVFALGGCGFADRDIGQGQSGLTRLGGGDETAIVTEDRARNA